MLVRRIYDVMFLISQLVVSATCSNSAALMLANWKEASAAMFRDLAAEKKLDGEAKQNVIGAKKQKIESMMDKLAKIDAEPKFEFAEAWVVEMDEQAGDTLKERLDVKTLEEVQGCPGVYWAVSKGLGGNLIYKKETMVMEDEAEEDLLCCM